MLPYACAHLSRQHASAYVSIREHTSPMKAGVVYSINSVRLQQLMRKAALLQLLHAVLQLIHKQRAVAAAYAYIYIYIYIHIIN
jgi:hypothetical protein